AFLLELDLGQAGFLQELRQLADQGLIDIELAHAQAFFLIRPCLTRPAIASRASAYPRAPRPQITPVAALLVNVWCRNRSRRWMLDRCTSITGSSAICKASSSAIEEWP